MARRRANKWQLPHRPLGMEPDRSRVEVGADGYDYEVRPIAGARATKTYRCPGCDHEIRSGTAHVVVWPAGLGESAVDDRRHWHTPCWSNRANRGPTRTWS
ncbi:hypothetical protein [Mycolicibacterium confluentis]|uniref:Uncharacterized protein n=1 Tax=Mycolicibacterium confluentis TaxID=28047 RepID=A0A7I7XU23_9MYCO|nr:hypothetical protein [Mycolicibacterium confluentis]ORV24342.1 hypothetical protein AWB99_22855 [Mycolicibacterium confluentis]BBZ32442.1 hypothetical protein MCNF_10470 [Mycolicibacterium confluentis]